MIAYEQTIEEKCHLLLSCLYYSVVTFTTLGYGDFTPIGISRAIAAIEAFIKQSYNLVGNRRAFLS